MRLSGNTIKPVAELEVQERPSLAELKAGKVWPFMPLEYLKPGEYVSVKRDRAEPAKQRRKLEAHVKALVERSRIRHCHFVVLWAPRYWQVLCRSNGKTVRIWRCRRCGQDAGIREDIHRTEKVRWCKHCKIFTRQDMEALP